MLLDKIKNYKIILGSQSPRRQYLLKELGIGFTVEVLNGIDESYPDNLFYDQIPVYLATHKAQHYKNLLDRKTILITADTIVWLDNAVINKPKDREDALTILKKLSGRKHEVLTGICLKTEGKEESFCSKTDVYFRILSDNEIAYYIDNFKPYDKAGAYGIQEWIGYAGIEKIEGSYFNVMGLPVQELYQKLSEFITN
jgi:septum formation protein